MRRALTVLALGLGTAGLLLVAPSAQAEPATPPPTLKLDATSQTSSGKLVARITAEARLKCDGMSAEAHAYAVEHKYCLPNGGAGTEDTRTGLCGSSWIDIFDDFPGDGVGRVEWGMNSFLGVMIYRNLYIDWAFSPVGYPLPIIGVLPDVGWMFTPYYSATGTAVSPSPSLLSVLLTGTVELIWGGTCEILRPQDFKRVS